MTVPISSARTAPIPSVLPPVPASWQASMQAGRTLRRRELNSTVFRSWEHLRASDWYNYLDATYDARTLAFPFALSHLEFFDTTRRLPTRFLDPSNLHHVGQTQLGRVPRHRRMVSARRCSRCANTATQTASSPWTTLAITAAI